MAPQTFQLGITASALGADVRQSPRIARTLGFAGLQFDAYSASLNLTDLPGSGRREFLRLLSGQDRRLVGLRYDLGPKGLSIGADVDRAIDRLDKVFDAAVSMAAPLVCVDIGPLPSPAAVVKPRPRISPDQAGLLILPTMSSAPPAPPEPASPPPDPAFVDQVDAALVEIGQRADRYSVVVALRSDLASFAALERALKAASCPWFGLDLDPASVLRDEWDLNEVFSTFGDLIRHVRGRDAAGPDRRTRPAVVGAGNTDWGVLLADLEASGFHGWITLDPIELTDRLGAAESGRKRLESIVG